MGSESNRTVGGGGGGLQVSPEVKKMVQQIREVVHNNCTDAEIYSVLRDCNMDANDAVQRLLSQDTFHEVKSKRERRKEVKETHESKGKGGNSGFRGNKIGGEYNFGRAVPSQLSYNDLGKAAHKKENGSVASSAPSSSSLIKYGKTMNAQLSPHSDLSSGHNRRQIAVTGDSISCSSQLSATAQSIWLRSPLGHVTMADVVKMGKQQHKVPHIAIETSSTHQDAESQNLSQNHVKPPCDHSSQQENDQDLQWPCPSNVLKANDERLTTSRDGFSDEWPGIDQQMSATRSSVVKISTVLGVEISSNKPSLNGEGTNLSFDSLSEKDAACKNPGSSCAKSASPSIEKDGSGAVGASDWGEGIESRSHPSFINDAAPLVDEVSSAAVNLQQLNLGKESRKPPSEDNHGFVFPNDMQALAVDCSHLSFGTYKSGGHVASSRPVASNSPKLYLDDAVIYGTSPAGLDTRNSGYFGDGLHDEQHGSMSNAHHLTADTGNHDIHLYSQPELITQNIPGVSGMHEYIPPSSMSDSNFKKTQDLSSALSVVINPNARNLPSLHRELQAMSTPVPIDLLASTAQSFRETEHTRSSFVGSQSMASRYSGGTTTIGGPTISMSEIPISSTFSLPTSYSPMASGASLATGPATPHHLSAQLYSQPTISLEELARFNSYPTVPQGYAQSPSALRHAYQDNNVFHGSLAGMKYSLPQYKTAVSSSNLPLSDANISGYGGFARAANFPGGFVHDLPGNPAGSAVGYDGLSSQHQERNNFTMLQQNGSSSRTFSPVPDSRYFPLTGQSPLPSRYQQSQQQSQDYGALLRADAYQSHSVVMQDQQQQGLSNAIFGGPQGASATNVHQLWQHNY